jgi:hypothetical protein
MAGALNKKDIKIMTIKTGKTILVRPNIKITYLNVKQNKSPISPTTRLVKLSEVIFNR